VLEQGNGYRLLPEVGHCPGKNNALCSPTAFHNAKACRSHVHGIEFCSNCIGIVTFGSGVYKIKNNIGIVSGNFFKELPCFILKPSEFRRKIPFKKNVNKERGFHFSKYILCSRGKGVPLVLGKIKSLMELRCQQIDQYQ